MRMEISCSISRCRLTSIWTQRRRSDVGVVACRLSRDFCCSSGLPNRRFFVAAFIRMTWSSGRALSGSSAFDRQGPLNALLLRLPDEFVDLQTETGGQAVGEHPVDQRAWVEESIVGGTRG